MGTIMENIWMRLDRRGREWIIARRDRRRMDGGEIRERRAINGYNRRGIDGVNKNRYRENILLIIIYVKNYLKIYFMNYKFIFNIIKIELE